MGQHLDHHEVVERYPEHAGQPDEMGRGRLPANGFPVVDLGRPGIDQRCYVLLCEPLRFTCPPDSVGPDTWAQLPSHVSYSPQVNHDVKKKFWGAMGRGT